jgi:hypothetical protein
VRDGTDEIDGVSDATGEVSVVVMAAVDEDDAGTFLFGFADLRAGPDSEGLGFIAGGDAAGGVADGGEAMKELRSMWWKANFSSAMAWISASTGWGGLGIDVKEGKYPQQTSKVSATEKTRKLYPRLPEVYLQGF